MVQQLTPSILAHLCRWAVEEATANWCRGVNSTLVLNLLMRTSKLCIMLMQEDYYGGMVRHIYGLLSLIKEPKSRDYEEELLSIIAYVINVEQTITL
jgi:hypothetical protein